MFLLEEDLALKTLLTGMTVTDDRRTARPVEVWFGQPDLELQQRTFPYISIDLVDINEAQERVVTGLPIIDYVPDGAPTPAVGQTLVAHNFPMPFDLDYLVTVWSRHPRHDRQITATMLRDRTPVRFGQLDLPETKRTVRLDMLGGGPTPSDSTDESGKRLFRKAFSLRVSTELFPHNALFLATRITSVVLPDLETLGTGDTP